jgi:hypothetical protein
MAADFEEPSFLFLREITECEDMKPKFLALESVMMGKYVLFHTFYDAYVSVIMVDLLCRQ